MKNALVKSSFLLLFFLLQISFATSDNNSTPLSSSTTTSSSLRGGDPLEDDNKKLKQEEEQKKKITGTETGTGTGKDDKAGETTDNLALLLPRNVEDGNIVESDHALLTMAGDSHGNLQQPQRDLSWLPTDPPGVYTKCLAAGDGGYQDTLQHAVKICSDQGRAGAAWSCDPASCLGEHFNGGRLSCQYRCSDVFIPTGWTPCVDKVDEAHAICKDRGKFRAESNLGPHTISCTYGFTSYCFDWPEPRREGWSPCFSDTDASARKLYHRDDLAKWWCKNKGNYPGGLTGAWNECHDINLFERYFTLECAR